MTLNSPAPSPVTVARFLRLIGSVAAATVGLIFLLVGFNLLATQGWTSATGTVQSCTSSYTGSGSSRQLQKSCDVTWTEGGVAHKLNVNFGTKSAANGQTVQLKVNGDNALLPAPLWVALLTFLVGLALVVLCIYLFLRSRRRAAATPAVTATPTTGPPPPPRLRRRR